MTKWCKYDKCKMTMMDALMELDKIIDESDPDVKIIVYPASMAG